MSRPAIAIAVLIAAPALLAAQAGSKPDRPVPRPPGDGPALQFDFPGVEIGVVEYDEGPTGATVFRFVKPVRAAVDVRGGAPGTIGTDALRLGYDVPFVNAIAFSGGSSYGLAVATGAAEEIKVRTADAGDWGNIAFVAGAIIFDLGGRRYTTVTPDEELGRTAVRAAKPGVFPQGPHGAGRFAMQGWYLGDPQHSGQGGAFRQVGPTKVAVFTVVNALGSIVDRNGRIVRCRGAPGQSCGLAADRLAAQIGRLGPTTADSSRRGGLTGNTTITLVITNQRIPLSALQRLAVQVHTSMGRAIQPFATEQDGDALYAVTTDEVENPAVKPMDLGVIAAEAAWDAVLATVPPLDSAPSATGASGPLDAFAGDYDFTAGARLTVARGGDTLFVTTPERASLYLPARKRLALTRLSATGFAIPGDRRDWIQFELGADGKATALVIDPGRWPIRATRVR